MCQCGSICPNRTPGFIAHACTPPGAYQRWTTCGSLVIHTKWIIGFNLFYRRRVSKYRAWCTWWYRTTCKNGIYILQETGEAQQANKEYMVWSGQKRYAFVAHHQSQIQHLHSIILEMRVERVDWVSGNPLERAFTISNGRSLQATVWISCRLVGCLTAQAVSRSLHSSRGVNKLKKKDDP